MNKKVLLDKLITFLAGKEDIDIPDKLEEKVSAYKYLALLNDLEDIPADILKDDDRFLRLDLVNRKLTDGEKVKSIEETLGSSVKHAKKIALWNGDVTTIYCDAIVNSTDEKVNGPTKYIKDHIDSEVHFRSGLRLRNKCKKVISKDSLDIGDVLITRAYNLPCDFIIHAVSPQVLDEVTNEDKEDLRRTYFNILECAKNNLTKVLVIPCISTGRGKFPKEEAAQIAYSCIDEYLDKYDDFFNMIIINTFNMDSYNIYADLLTKKND
ncbi:MAG: macro domain-containing protein [Bacilli bacterium]|nr:macro domain-containing protein [Bacilli bacterium]